MGDPNNGCSRTTLNCAVCFPIRCEPRSNKFILFGDEDSLVSLYFEGLSFNYCVSSRVDWSAYYNWCSSKIAHLIFSTSTDALYRPKVEYSNEKRTEIITDSWFPYIYRIGCCCWIHRWCGICGADHYCRCTCHRCRCQWRCDRCASPVDSDGRLWQRCQWGITIIFGTVTTAVIR